MMAVLKGKVLGSGLVLVLKDNFATGSSVTIFVFQIQDNDI